MNLKMKFRSEDGNATVMEAALIYPIVCLVTVLLVFVGFTYAKQGFLVYHSENLASYLAKVVCMPGYQEIDDDPFSEGETVTQDDIKKAMKKRDPYRYLFGVFSSEYNMGSNGHNDLAEYYANKMANEYLKEHGFLKAYNGSVDLPDGVNFKDNHIASKDGYICAISANTSRVVVFLGQDYVFSNLFRMIGVGGRRMPITSLSTAFVSDSLEIVRTTDMVFDVTALIAGKLGFDTSKIKTLKDIVSKFTK